MISPRKKTKRKTRFLSVYTATYNRPQLLDRCMTSVLRQSLPCEHIIVHDHVGLGVAGMYTDVKNHAHRCTGDYVMMLNDDDYLRHNDVVWDLWQADHGSDAEVLMFRGDLCGEIYPREDSWRFAPNLGSVCISNFAMRNDIWLKHARDWQPIYEADFAMIDLLWKQNYTFKWLDPVVFVVDRVSRGQPELESATS